MKNKNLIFLFLAVIVFSLTVFAKQGWAQANVCFCHETSSPDNPFDTICTNDQGQQQGHTNHGDPDFGCFCGDGTCDPEDGETPETCPQDCGPPPTCGDGDINDGEECGEEGLGECEAEGETCQGCRCAPPQPDCFQDEDCDDGDACNGQETCSNQRSCESGVAPTCDDGLDCSVDACNPETGACESDMSSCACSQNSDCDDGNPCTADSCNLALGQCESEILYNACQSNPTPNPGENLPPASNGNGGASSFLEGSGTLGCSLSSPVSSGGLFAWVGLGSLALAYAVRRKR